jgi:hypothetical protein
MSDEFFKCGSVTDGERVFQKLKSPFERIGVAKRRSPATGTHVEENIGDPDHVGGKHKASAPRLA